MSKFPVPYYAVIFTSIRTDDDAAGYAAMAARMEALSAGQPGFLGMESARNAIGITVSYWTDLESIARWKAHVDHLEAQHLGREKWYAQYTVRIARVERHYDFERTE